MSANTEHPGQHESHEHHLSPLGMYVKVFAGLICLTLATIAVSYCDFGIMNIVVAMLIAVAKACLVIFFFMQLKFDDIGNKVTFAASFVFLTVFISLTGSDLFFRHHPEPMKIANVNGAAAGETDQNKLRIGTPELVAKGKELFHQNACYTCHGETGQGNGMAAAALTPKPRDFTSGYWKFGGAPTQVFHTITNGSPGTGMAPYGHLSVADRYALVHYVRHFHSPQPDDTPETLKTAGLLGGGKGVAQAEEKPSIPIEMAMAKLEIPDQVLMPSGPEKDPESAGRRIYHYSCEKCHGINGMGAQTMALGVNPPISIMTASWAGSTAPWASNAGDFEHLVMTGFPGRGMPGMATFSKSDIGQLFAYVKELAHK